MTMHYLRPSQFSHSVIVNSKLERRWNVALVCQHRVLFRYLTGRDNGELKENPGTFDAKPENLTGRKVRGFITGGISPGTETKYVMKTVGQTVDRKKLL